MSLRKIHIAVLIGALLAVVISVCTFAQSVTVTFMDGKNIVEQRTVESGTKMDVYDNKFKSGNEIFRDEKHPSAEKYLAGWRNADGTQLHKSAVRPTQDMTLYAVWADVPKTPATPGQNVFGSVSDYFGLSTTGGYLTVVNDAALGKDVVKFVRLGNGYQAVQTPVMWEKGRKYKLVGYIRNDIAGDNASVVYNVRYYTKTANSGSGDHGTGLTSQNGTSWRKFDTSFTFDAEDYVSNYYANFFAIYQNPYTHDSWQSPAYDVYFADLSLVPYYKVSFDANGGTGAPEALQTLSAAADISAVTQVPQRAGHTFLGWGTAPDSDSTVTSVATGKDVTLYAVWERTDNDSHIITLVDGNSVYTTLAVAKGQKCSVNSSYFKNGNGIFTDRTNADGAEKYLVGWENADGTRLYNGEFYPDADMTLYAVWGDVPNAPAQSGVNLFSSLDDFYGLRGAGGYLTIVRDETLDKDVVKYVRCGNGYQSVQIPVMWEKGRTYKLTGSVRNDLEGNNKDVFYNVRFYTQENQKYEGDHAKWLVAQKARTWRSFDVDFTFDSDFHADADSFVSNYYANFFSIYANPYAHDSTQSPAYDVYFTDLSLVPYYRVSFDANGGTGAPEALQTLESRLDISGVKDAPTREGYSFAGWGLTDGAVNAVTAVEDISGDVTLYAIWQATGEYPSVITYSFASDKKGDAQGTITLSAAAEAAGYTTAAVYYADNMDILGDYTALCTLDVTSGTAAYTMAQGRTFPKNATRLCAVFSAEDKKDIKYWYTIPQSKQRNSTEKPRFTIYSISDIHYGDNVDDHAEATINRANAMRDIGKAEPDLVLANGDLINFGHEQRHYDAVSDLFKESFNDLGIPTLVSIGNHEYYNAASVAKDWREQSFIDFMAQQLDFASDYGYEINWDSSKLYYSASKDGMRFIVLATPYPTASPEVGGFALAVSEEQLKWLDEQLYNAEKSGQITFVMTHVPLNGYFPNNSGVGVYNKGISNTEDVKAVLNKHRNVFVATAHTHSNLSLDYEWISLPELTGDSFVHYNDGCTSWTSVPNGNGGSKQERGYGIGQYIEIYDDRVVFMARIFDDECKFVSTGLYAIDIKDADKPTGDVSISTQMPFVGDTLKALYNGAEISSVQSAEWFADGICVGTGASFEITHAYEGKKLALRVTNSDGSYASALSEVVGKAPVTFGFGSTANYTYKTSFEGITVQSAVVAAAMYSKDGRLLDVGIKNVADSSFNVAVSTQDDVLVKVFVFDDMEGLKPVSEVKTAVRQ